MEHFLKRYQRRRIATAKLISKLKILYLEFELAYTLGPELTKIQKTKLKIKFLQNSGLQPFRENFILRLRFHFSKCRLFENYSPLSLDTRSEIEG